MAIPYRGRTGDGTYFVTASCAQKMNLLQTNRAALLFIEVAEHYRSEGKFLLHEFVVMPNHFHLLISPLESLERALQLIKGGFSFRAKREIGLHGDIWQTSFYDRRVRDWAEWRRIREYIRDNPVRRGLAGKPEEWPFGSACGRFPLDEVPQRLKPPRQQEELSQA